MVDAEVELRLTEAIRADREKVIEKIGQHPFFVEPEVLLLSSLIRTTPIGGSDE